MQVILDSSFAHPGSAPIWGGKKGEFRDWTTDSVVQQHGGVLELFSRFRRGAENRGFIRIKKFFPRSISNNK